MKILFSTVIFFLAVWLAAGQEPGATGHDDRLALAQRYATTENYDTALSLLHEIHAADPTNLEALNALGNILLLTGETAESIVYFEKALQLYPGKVQQYFYLAKAYSFAAKLDEAIRVYREINAIDSTYAEAWAGIGKMYYWKGKPKTALRYYEKALELDPSNEETSEEYRKIKNELRFVLTLKSGPVRETEETYEINAIISRITVEKRINDWFLLEANFLLDYSSRVFTGHLGDTTRWYNTPWIKAGWLSEHHRISAWVGYTPSDERFSSYGLNWMMNYSFGKFTVKNSLSAGYDYFYYWNEVGAKSVTDNLGLGYGKLELNAFYTYGVADSVRVADAYSGTYGNHENPYTSYGASLAYKVLSRPVIKAGLNYSFLDYTYKSPLYYTPFERNLVGGMASVYYDLKRFYFYGSFSYNFGKEIFYEQRGNSDRFDKVKLDVDNWSANIELGYQRDPFSISVGGSNFYNPFYRSISGFLAFKLLF